jgi:hypothetical protein
MINLDHRRSLKLTQGSCLPPLVWTLLGSRLNSARRALSSLHFSAGLSAYKVSIPSFWNVSARLYRVPTDLQIEVIRDCRAREIAQAKPQTRMRVKTNAMQQGPLRRSISGFPINIIYIPISRLPVSARPTPYSSLKTVSKSVTPESGYSSRNSNAAWRFAGLVLNTSVRRCVYIRTGKLGGALRGGLIYRILRPRLI